MIDVLLLGTFTDEQQSVMSSFSGTRWNLITKATPSSAELTVATLDRFKVCFEGQSLPDNDVVVVWIDDFNLSVIDQCVNQGAVVLFSGLSHSAYIRQLEDLTLQIEKQQQAAFTYDQLLRSERLSTIGQLAAGVAHEINNPIGFVSSNTNLVVRYVSDIEADLDQLAQYCEEEETGIAVLLHARWLSEAKITHHLTDLAELTHESIEGLARVQAIIGDLKNYARGDDAIFESCDINTTLQTSLNLLRNEIKYKAELLTHFADIPPVNCIVSQIGQVFVNILANACQAIEGFGTLTVCTKAVDGGVEVSIADTGKGMNDAQMAKAFEPFYTTKPKGTGTGIGLSISADIVQRHQGKISVSSEVGVGTTFTLWLPLMQN